MFHVDGENVARYGVLCMDVTDRVDGMSHRQNGKHGKWEEERTQRIKHCSGHAYLDVASIALEQVTTEIYELSQPIDACPARVL